VPERTLEWFELLSRVLLGAAAIVLVLGVIAASSVGATEEVPLFEEVQRQGRTIAVFGALAGSVFAAGVLAGLGALLRLKVAEVRAADKTE